MGNRIVPIMPGEGLNGHMRSTSPNGTEGRRTKQAIDNVSVSDIDMFASHFAN